MAETFPSKARPSSTQGPRSRQGFKLEDLDSAPGEDKKDVVYLDEQTQEELIQQLVREDAMKNEFYSVTLYGHPLVILFCCLPKS